MAREKLGEILIRAGLLDQEGLQRALNEQQRWGGMLGRYLVELKLISEETLVRALATQYKLPAVSLEPARLSLQVGKLIPKEICERYGVVCFRADVKKRFIDVAMADPSNLDAIDEIRVKTQYNVRPYIAAPSVIDNAITRIFYGELSIGNDIKLAPSSSDRYRAVSAPPPDPTPPPPARSVEESWPRSQPEPPRETSRPAAAAEPWGSGITVSRPVPLPSLEVEISPSDQEDDEDEPPTQIASVQLPPPVVDDGFHITLDVPAVDKANLSKNPSLEERLTLLEATVSRNSAILQAMLDVLLRKGLLSQKDILRLLQQK